MARSKYAEVELDMIKDIAINLKKLLHLKGINQSELSDKTGLSTSTISDYTNGRTLMSPGNLQKIADALNVLKSDINSSLKGSRQYKQIPLLGTICAGEGMLAEQNIEEYIHYPFQDNHQPDYALRVNGDSMVGAGIESGDIVYMRSAQWVDRSGQIACVLINGDQDGTLKRVKWSEKSPKIQLVPENSAHKTIEVLPNEMRVCGVYMGHFRLESIQEKN